MLTYREIRVVHFDHTSAYGGAEIALSRLLTSSFRRWKYLLVLPIDSLGELGPFEALLGSDRVLHRRPRQLSGATSSSLLRSIGLGVRAISFGVSTALIPQVWRADLLHANSTRSAISAFVTSFLLRKPLVVHLRDIVSPEALGILGHLLLSKVILPHASGVIANSDATLNSAVRYIGTSAVSAVIPSPIGVSVLNSTPKVRKKVEAIGMVARIDNWKGQDLLLNAYAKAFPGGDRPRLRLIGGAPFTRGGLLSELKAQADRLGISETVEFVGQVSPDSVSKYIDELDVCVQASTRPEPLGQNVLQYLARGKPTVVSGEGGPVEWVRNNENGLVFTPRSVDDLATCLSRLTCDFVLRLSLSTNSLKSVRGVTDQEIVSQHWRLFQNILSTIGEKR